MFLSLREDTEDMVGLYKAAPASNSGQGPPPYCNEDTNIQHSLPLCRRLGCFRSTVSIHKAVPQLGCRSCRQRPQGLSYKLPLVLVKILSPRWIPHFPQRQAFPPTPGLLPSTIPSRGELRALSVVTATGHGPGRDLGGGGNTPPATQSQQISLRSEGGAGRV